MILYKKSIGVSLVLLLLLVFSVNALGSQRTQFVQGSIVLGNQKTLSFWANSEARKMPIRYLPNSASRVITQTHYLTSDGFPEVYLVLRKYKDLSHRAWLEIRIPMRPNGRVGWVRDLALSPLYKVHTLLIVDRHSLRATLYKNGRRIWSAGVGIGKPGTPTPPGNFWIREKFQTHAPGSLYGPVAFGTSDYSVLTDWPGGGVIGIHGTNEPGLIPGRPSHGCIRIKNSKVLQLWPLLPIGTPLWIR